MSQDSRHMTVGRAVTEKQGLLPMRATMKVVSRDPVARCGQRIHLQSETKDKMKTERGRGAVYTVSPGQYQTA